MGTNVKHQQPACGAPFRPETAQFVDATRGKDKRRKGSHVNRTAWVRAKKERHRRQGKEVRQGHREWLRFWLGVCGNLHAIIYK